MNCFAKTDNRANGLLAERQATRKGGQNGKQNLHDLICDCTVSSPFAHSIFYDNNCRNSLQKLLRTTLVFSFEGIMQRVSAFKLHH